MCATSVEEYETYMQLLLLQTVRPNLKSKRSLDTLPRSKLFREKITAGINFTLFTPNSNQKASTGECSFR